MWGYMDQARKEDKYLYMGNTITDDATILKTYDIVTCVWVA